MKTFFGESEKMRRLKKPNVTIVTFPFNNKAGLVTLKEFLALLDPLFRKIIVITGSFSQILANKNISIIEIKYLYPTKDLIVLKIIKYLVMQIKISFHLLRYLSNTDVFIFFLGGTQFLLPLLNVKLMGKKTIGIMTQAPSKSEKALNYRLLKKLILYSRGVIQLHNLKRYKHKISIAPQHFVDINKFTIKKEFNERENFIGYVGRLSEEKGILNFTKAILTLSKEREELKFLIGGEGRLQDKIERYLEEKNLNAKVKFAGWIPHTELPDYLNKLKLLVLPSYTEGLPLVMLEAMACGTPVLAARVGSIPDLIKDGKTGFILEKNSPDCIAENVIRALEHSNLDEIVKNAREFVEKKTYEAAVERYRKILQELQ